MNAQGIIKCIRETNDEKSIELLRNIFMFAYLRGINRGYDSAIKLSKNHPLNSDVEEAKVLFKQFYL